MHFRTKARRGRIPRAFQQSITFDGQNLTTVVNPVNTCGHHRATVRNVIEPDGAAAYVCRDCFAYLKTAEFKTVIRRQFLALFRSLLPRISRSGALMEVAHA